MDAGTKSSHFTILPLGVLNGQADEYSKPVLGSITGCSPITPIPLEKKASYMEVQTGKSKNKRKIP